MQIDEIVIDTDAETVFDAKEILAGHNLHFLFLLLLAYNCSLFIGAFGGCSQALVGHPFDTLKV